ncbi:Eukaryotic translation initiation factor 3 subunit I [Blattella germanica]|nr:Eukaryotic translation initiation factor 3 subunit I [Blattella germanica]
MADTSKYTIEERLIISVWVHEKERSGETYEEIRENFFIRFNKAAPSEANLRKLEKQTFSTGSVLDTKHSGRPKNIAAMAITQIKYNREGDLLFSSAKDHVPNVWYSLNGERLGTFEGHQGAVWAIDVNWDTTRFMSGAADQLLRIWDCATGCQVGKIENCSSVRSCNFSYSANMAAYSTDAHLRQQCEIFIIDVRNADESIGKYVPYVLFYFFYSHTVICS